MSRQVWSGLRRRSERRIGAAKREGKGRRGIESPSPRPFDRLRSGERGNPFDRSAIEPSGAGREATGRVAPAAQRREGEVRRSLVMNHLARVAHHLPRGPSLRAEPHP
jgi:hypothetical protein